MFNKKIFAGLTEKVTPPRFFLDSTTAGRKAQLDILSPNDLESLLAGQFLLDVGKAGKYIQRHSGVEAMRNYSIALIQGVETLSSKPDNRSAEGQAKDFARFKGLTHSSALKKMLAYYYIFNLGKKVALDKFDVRFAVEQYKIAANLALKQRDITVRHTELRKMYKSAVDVYKKMDAQLQDNEPSADLKLFQIEILFPILMKHIGLLFSTDNHGLDHQEISALFLDADYLALTNFADGQLMRETVATEFDKYVTKLKSQGDHDLAEQFQQTIGYKMITDRLQIMAEVSANLFGNNFSQARNQFIAAMNIVNQMPREESLSKKIDVLKAYLLIVSKLSDENTQRQWAQEILLPMLNLDERGTNYSVRAELAPIIKMFQSDSEMARVLKQQLDYILALYPAPSNNSQRGSISVIPAAGGAIGRAQAQKRFQHPPSLLDRLKKMGGF